MTEHADDHRLMRLLAVTLMALWAAIAIVVATAYRPGGPIDIVVALACFVPVAVADAGVVWPASGLSRRHRVALVWVWVAAMLFAIPVLYGIASTLAADGPQSLVPSLEAAYAGDMALVAMAFFSVVGLVHRRRGVAATGASCDVAHPGLAAAADRDRRPGLRLRGRGQRPAAAQRATGQLTLRSHRPGPAAALLR